MHFCRICRTEKNLKYTVKELRKLGRKRSNERLLGTTPTLGNICHECEERLHNFHRLDENEEGDDHEERIIVDDDDLLYNLFFQKVGRIMGNGGEWHRQPLRQQTLVAATAAVAVNTDEVIEVLTSRENTPSPAPKAWPPATIKTTAAVTQKPTANESTAMPSSDIKLSPNNYKVVAVIDLEADEESAAMCVPQESDEEEIVFRSVEPEAVKPMKDTTISTTRRSANREVRLIASLSLLSSDESDLDDAVESSRIKKLSIAESPKCAAINAISENSEKSALSPLKCKECGLCMRTLEELKCHECLKAGVKCPVCECDFAASQRLIHHMRCKHRSYEGDVLLERPRCAQDSAMTIRLRYLQRYTYYECQLCGRIDAVFKEHKQHVMQQHAAESKSLKDPMMQELKCPVCKEKCGPQYILLCRHLLAKHSDVEYHVHMREVTHLRTVFNCSVSKQKELRRSARVFQFTKRKSLFFECRHCQKIVTGHFNHLKHWSTHNGESVKTTLGSSEAVSGKRTKPNVIAEREEKAKDTAPKENSTTKQTRQLQAQTQKNSQATRHKERKLTKRAVQAALVKVKVKPPLRQLATQKYECQCCAEVLLGFHRLNLHRLSKHKDDEQRFYCATCTQSFDKADKLLKHSKVHPAKQKRKLPNGQSSEALLEINANEVLKKQRRIYPKLCKSELQFSYEVEEEQTNCNNWLSDLKLLIGNKKLQRNIDSNDTNETANNTALPLQQKVSVHAKEISHNQHELRGKQKLVNLFATSHQCQYCTHLFVTAAELRRHEAKHLKLQEVKMIKRVPINAAASLTKANSHAHAAP